MRFEVAVDSMRLTDVGKRSFYASVTVGPWTAWLQRWRSRDLPTHPSTGARAILLRRDWAASMSWECGFRSSRKALTT